MDIEQLSALVGQFVDERNWYQFHTPKNLALAITSEAGELAQCLRWKTEGEPLGPTELSQIRDELADIIIFCLAMFNRLCLDETLAILDKLEKNKEKYPIVEWIGRAK